ncbi:hypothetical protein LIPSTDRAFT_67868 [Lipomyces starkeyi NRRL Y-11557]|uniref:Uncharacterized protein n=1 Tax=Lipomyces starkeyi NRRL Y-11557 TaxID=675824 RepID=A0A1E3QHD6_LIPST|nr:hypothetical protein LIPSTDRAFT_67868 [Lipomyces starkeyi NRRL Y-11557]
MPGISLPFTSRQTLRHRLMEDFDFQRVKFKELLSATCKTIKLLCPLMCGPARITSQSSVSLATGSQRNSNIDLERKLLSITGDNASNNERMVL